MGFFSVHVCFMCFFLVDLSAKTTKPEVDISTCKDTQGRGRRVVQLAEAARETQIMDFLWVPYLEMIWRPNMDDMDDMDDTSKDSQKICVIVPKLQHFLFSDHVSLGLLNERPRLLESESCHFSRWFGSCQSGRWEWHRLLKALIWLDDLSSLVNWKDLNRLSNQIKSWVCSDKKWRTAISIYINKAGFRIYGMN